MDILIVDDEPLARSRLRTLLEGCAKESREHYQIHEAGHATDALEQLETANGRMVDIVLLDIHMPGLDGLALAQRMQQFARPPAIIFVTAHAEHALNAFDLNAVDYLTKPVRQQRLQQALVKAGRVALAPPTAPEFVGDGDSLLIQERGRTERVPMSHVLYIKAEQKYLTVRTVLQSYVIEGSLQELEARHGAHLLRVHRNALVARRAIRSL